VFGNINRGMDCEGEGESGAGAGRRGTRAGGKGPISVPQGGRRKNRGVLSRNIQLLDQFGPVDRATRERGNAPGNWECRREKGILGVLAATGGKGVKVRRQRDDKALTIGETGGRRKRDSKAIEDNFKKGEVESWPGQDKSRKVVRVDTMKKGTAGRRNQINE